MNLTGVMLPAIHEASYDKFNAEPQMVRVRAPNRANLYMSWPEAPLGGANFAGTTTLERLVDGSIVNLGIDSTIARNVKRIAISEARWSSTLDNVNPTNNTVIVQRSDNPVPFVLKVPPAAYPTPTLLMAALNAQLATVLTGGMTYTLDPIVVGDENTFLLTTSIPVAFDPQCSAVRFGKSLWNIVALGEVSADMPTYMRTQTVIGPCYCLPTYYVEFFSNTLTQYTKLPNATTREGNGNIIYRIYLDKWTSGVNTQQRIYDSNPHPAWITFNPEQSFTTIDISLGDMYGRPLYIDKKAIPPPPTAPDRYFDVDVSGITFDLTLCMEI